jgi:hypothetical protein
MKTSMSSGSCLTSKLCDKIIKMPSKSHETIPLKVTHSNEKKSFEIARRIAAIGTKKCNLKGQSHEKVGKMGAQGESLGPN